MAGRLFTDGKIVYKVGRSSSGVKIIYRWRDRLQVGRLKQVDDRPQLMGLSTGKKIFHRRKNN
jgi:hypothetical protein